MRELRLATIGRILAGQEAGRFVEVIDDHDASGGFLVVSYEFADRSGEGFDSWVETIVDVELYFDEAGWIIEWLAE